MICGAAAKRRPRLVVGDQVDVALAVARLDVGEAVPLLRQRPQRLGEHAERLRASIVSSPVLVRNGVPTTPTKSPTSASLNVGEGVLAERVALHVHLEPAVAIEQVEKRRLAEVALGDDAPGDGDRRRGAAASCSAA